MTTNAADLVLEYLVVKSGLKLSLPSGSPRHLHRRLTATKNDKVLLPRHAGAVERCVGNICLENLQILGSDELCRLVLGGRDEVRSVGRPLEIRNGHVELVHLNVDQLLTSLRCLVD